MNLVGHNLPSSPLILCFMICGVQQALPQARTTMDSAQPSCFPHDGLCALKLPANAQTPLPVDYLCQVFAHGTLKLQT